MNRKCENMCVCAFSIILATFRILSYRCCKNGKDTSFKF